MPAWMSASRICLPGRMARCAQVASISSAQHLAVANAPACSLCPSPTIPLPAPPPDTLIASAAALPAPLRRFRGRDQAFAPDPDRPVVAFPPDGAILRVDGGAIPLRLRKGTLPMTVLVNGRPQITALRRRDGLLHIDGPGFSRIAVVDAKGRAAQVEIRLD